MFCPLASLASLGNEINISFLSTAGRQILSKLKKKCNQGEHNEINFLLPQPGKIVEVGKRYRLENHSFPPNNILPILGEMDPKLLQKG